MTLELEFIKEIVTTKWICEYIYSYNYNLDSITNILFCKAYSGTKSDDGT